MRTRTDWNAVRESVDKGLGKGIVTIPADAELIPSQTSQDSLGFISTDGQIELTKGRLLLGAEETASSFVQGEGWGYKRDGTAVHFRKINTKLQYYDTVSMLWVDIVTGLTAGAEYTISKYQSVAGSFVFATGIDGIYKIHTANPANFCSMYDASKNFKGKSMIGTSRMFLWDRKEDKTGLYCSYIDLQDASTYTTVAPEATAASTSGTLAFKAGDAKRTCFAVVITITASGEIFTDDYNGNLVGSLGGTGTINYTTGAWTLSTSSAGTAVYSWEMTNNKGITDFTFSGTRTAGQGNVFRQDEGGDSIQNVEIHEGKYYSLKSRSVYELDISSTPPYADLTATNKIFRRDIGLQYWRTSVSTGKGIIFMNTSDLSKPQLTILQKNIQGDNLVPVTLANHFDFSAYVWDMSAMTTYGEFIVFSGRTSASTINNKLFMYNIRRDTVDILPYGAKTITSAVGVLYCGDTQTENCYELLSGFDDDNDTIENYWISNDELFNTNYLKKIRRFRVKGVITPDQVLEVYIGYDNDTPNLVGTIRGNGSYVDHSESYSVGSQGIGTTVVGGEANTLKGSFFIAELKIASTKFRKRTVKLKAVGIGYLAINMIEDWGIKLFQQKLPSKYRTKQNVSKDGLTTDTI